MPMYAALAYDAVNVLARAFHQVINVDKESKYNGKLIVQAMEEMEYESKFYVTITSSQQINSNFARNSPFDTLFHLVPTKSLLKD